MRQALKVGVSLHHSQKRLCSVKSIQKSARNRAYACIRPQSLEGQMQSFASVLFPTQGLVYVVSKRIQSL